MKIFKRWTAFLLALSLFAVQMPVFADETEEPIPGDVKEQSQENNSEETQLFSIIMPEEQENADDENALATYRFYAADNQTVISKQILKKGDTLLSPATPEKKGYVFLGWATTPNATVVEKDAFISEELTDQTQGAEINYYPVFTNSSIVVQFMHPNGSVLQSKQGAAGDTITTTDVNIKLDSEHRITGWYFDEALTQAAGDSLCAW